MAVIDLSALAIAGSPFDEGDIVLASPDNMGFYVHRIMLTVASPYFKTLFSLPQPSASTHSDVAAVPIIPVKEEGRILELLLRLCYPVRDPIVSTLAEVRDVLMAALKYEMSEAIELMSNRLTDFTTNESLLVFAIACSLKLEEQACKAAKSWQVRQTTTREDPTIWSKTTEAFVNFAEDMKNVSAGSYFRLLECVRTGKLDTICSPPIRSTHNASADADLTKIYSCEDGDVILRSMDGNDFRTYKLLLAMAGPSILELPTLPAQDGISIIQTDQNSQVLAMILALCLPLAERDLRSFDMAEAIWRAGEKYNIPRMCDIARAYVVNKINGKPLSVFFIAYRCGWEKEMVDSLRRCVAMDLAGVYAPEMEDTPAEVYYNLLKCSHEYKAAVRSLSEGVQQYSNEAGSNTYHLWSLGGLHASNSAGNPVPATLFAPLVERSLRYAAKTQYCFNVRELIDASSDLGKQYEEALAKVIMGPKCVPVFSPSSDGANDSSSGKLC